MWNDNAYTHIHTYKYAYLHACYIHTYIHTYNAYIHAHIYMYACICHIILDGKKFGENTSNRKLADITIWWMPQSTKKN